MIATDVDDDHLRYSLNTNTDFTIDASGVIRTQSTFDREDTDVYHIDVMVGDGGVTSGKCSVLN